MSLINDALKKAQKQRSQEPAAAAAFTPGKSIASSSGATSGKASLPSKPRSVRPLVILGLCAVMMSVVSVGTTLFILHSDSPSVPPAEKVSGATPVAPATPPPKPAAVTSEIVASPSPARAAIPSAAMAPLFVPPGQTAIMTSPKTETPAHPPTTLPEVNFARSRPVEASIQPNETETVAHLPPLEPPKASMRIQGVIDKLRVAGIRVSPTESKVILNERLFRLNDVVDPVLGLRLTVVELHALTFTDSSGATYVKLF